MGIFGSRSPEQPSRNEAGAYAVDEHDTVQVLKDIPQSSVGALMPIVIASEHSLAHSLTSVERIASGRHRFLCYRYRPEGTSVVGFHRACCAGGRRIACDRSGDLSEWQ